jgi:hypothetical protein
LLPQAKLVRRSGVELIPTRTIQTTGVVRLFYPRQLPMVFNFLGQVITASKLAKAMPRCKVLLNCTDR